ADQRLTDGVVIVGSQRLQQDAKHQCRQIQLEGSLDQKGKRLVGRAAHQSSPSSRPRLTAACTALSTSVSKPLLDKLSRAAAVVPPGEVTRLRSSPASTFDLASMVPAPKAVWRASRAAVSALRPAAVPAAVRCSTSAKK